MQETKSSSVYSQSPQVTGFVFYFFVLPEVEELVENLVIIQNALFLYFTSERF
jgi:hypothetical protein